MPIVEIRKDLCSHGDIHPKWKSRDGEYLAICMMATPHIENVIRLLEETLLRRAVRGKSKRAQGASSNDEFQLEVLMAEIERRKANLT